MQIVLHIVLALLGIIVCASVLLLWAEVTADIASNGKKTILELSIFRFLKYELCFPPEYKRDGSGKRKDKKNKKDKKKKKNNKNKKDKAKDRIKREADDMWDEEENFFAMEEITEKLHHYHDIYSNVTGITGAFLRWMENKIKFAQCGLYLHFGLGEADKTGKAYGGAYSLWYTMYAMLSGYFVFKNEPQLVLAPEYNSRCFDFETRIVIKTRSAYVFHALCAALIVYIKYYINTKKIPKEV